MSFTRTFVTVVVLLSAGASLVSADSRISFKTTEGQGAAFQGVLIGQGKIRTDADKSTSIIIDPSTAGTLTILDHGRKVFIRFTRADLDQLLKSFDDLMKQMEQMMANMPPEMKKNVQSMLGGGPAGAIDVADSGERATVAGVSCRIFRTRVADRVVNEMCMSDAGALNLPAADRKTLLAAIAMSKELVTKLSKGPLGRYANMMPLRDGMVPVRITDIGSDGARSTSEFAGVTSEPIPAATFDVPEGYKEQKIELPKIGRGGR